MAALQSFLNIPEVKFLLSLFLVIGLAGSALGNETLAGIIAKLSAEKKADRDDATTALVVEGIREYRKNLPLIAAAHRGNKDPEARARLLSILRSLYKIEELNESPGVFGFVVGWYIDHNGENLKSLPMVMVVVPGTPAEAAGFKPGDVILECAGKSYRSLDSRNELIRDLGALPIGTEASFKVMFNGDKNAFSTDPKKQNEVRVMKSAPRSDFSEGSRFSEDEFRAWVKAIKLSD